MQYIFDEAYIFGIVNFLDVKLSQLIDSIIRYIFRKCFMWFRELGAKPKHSLIANLPKLIKNQL